MRRIIFFSLLLLFCSLCSCSAIMRETGFVAENPEKHDDYIDRTFSAHYRPTVELSSSCTSNIALTKDIKKASDSYLKAAERGYMQSQYNLASLYSNQYLESQNDVEGYTWMVLARNAAQRCIDQSLCDWILKDPPGHTTKLKNRLSVDQINQVESLAKSWKPKN